MKTSRYLFISVIVLGWALGVSGVSCSAQTPDPAPDPTVTSVPVNERISGQVKDVLAGDTYRLQSGLMVKLAGISCYEPFSIGWVDSFFPERRKLGLEAKRFAEQQVLNKPISYEVVPEYPSDPAIHRVIVYVAGTQSLNELLLSKGYARILVGTPNHPLLEKYRNLQQTAFNEKAGIWAIDFSKINVPLGTVAESPEAPRDDVTRYRPPVSAHQNVSQPESETGSSNVGLIFGLAIVCSIIIAVVYAVRMTTATKPCPMCQSKIHIKDIVCDNCGYNFKTGHYGDAELQSWMTQNVRVVKKSRKPPKR